MKTYALTITVVLDLAPDDDPADALSTYFAENGIPDPMVEEMR